VIDKKTGNYIKWNLTKNLMTFFLILNQSKEMSSKFIV
jgi:hypothetical protein